MCQPKIKPDAGTAPDLANDDGGSVEKVTANGSDADASISVQREGHDDESSRSIEEANQRPEKLSSTSAPRPGEEVGIDVVLSVVDRSAIQRSDRGAISDHTTFGHLHPASLWLPCVELLIGSIVPAFIAMAFVGVGRVVYVGCVFVLLPTAVYHGLRFFTLRFGLTDSELVIQSGLFFRRERRIPFDRVQEIKLQQGIVHRVLGLVKLEITTAGSDAQEANLNVLSKLAADKLKDAISSKPEGETVKLGHDPRTPIEFDCTLSIRDLLWGGVTSRLVASLGAVISAIVYFQLFLNLGGRWFEGIEKGIEEDVQRRAPAQIPFKLFENLENRFRPDLGPLDFAVDLVFNDTLTKSIALVLFGLAVSVVTYVIRYHGFRLSRSGDLLTTSHGLLTFRRTSLARNRIQALKLEEGLLRRWFGLASVRADSAGDRSQIDDSKKREVLVPVASKEVAQEIARQAMPGLTDLEPAWQRISPRAVMRGSKKGWLLTLIAMVQTYGVAGWFCLVWLPAIPLVYLLNLQWYRHTGYWFDGAHFLFRKGWLNRATVCMPLKNIQNVSLIQSFFDRRLNLATLSIDTAGQSNTGGGPLIRHLPVEVARDIQQTLTAHAARSEFAW